MLNKTLALVAVTALLVGATACSSSTPNRAVATPMATPTYASPSTPTYTTPSAPTYRAPSMPAAQGTPPAGATTGTGCGGCGGPAGCG